MESALFLNPAATTRSRTMRIIRGTARAAMLTRYSFLLAALAAGWTGCAESVKHDETLAGRQAMEFASVAFVKQDFENGHSLLSDGAKRYVSVEQFKEVVARLHPRAFPVSVTATDFEPMPGEKAIHIYLTGENPSEHFYYRITMDGTATTGYRAVRFYRQTVPYPDGGKKQKIRG